jgi:hypothetical protein
MSRENHYLLLDLDPDEQDLDAILAALKKKRDEWSRNCNHPNPAVSKAAQQNLGRLRDIEQLMRDEDLRRQEAADARRELDARRARNLADLDEALRLVSAKGYLEETDFPPLVQRFRRRLTEAEIRERVHGLGIEIRTATRSVAPAPGPLLESTTFKSIQATLTRLQLPDLYAFLDMPRTCTAGELRKRADQLYGEVRLVANKTAEVTTRQELVGHALNVFRSEEERTRYDNSLADQKLDSIRQLAETAGAGSGRLTVEVMDALLEQGAREGIPLAGVRQALIELAQRRGWPIAEPVKPSVADRQRCGVCGELGLPAEAGCKRCGTPFRLTCPKCQTLNTSEARFCTRLGCGFAIGNMALAPRLIRDARVALARNDRAEASRFLADALVWWPDHPEAVQLHAAIRQREERVQQALQVIDRALLQNACETARAALDDLRRSAPDYPRIAEYETRIAEGLSQASTEAARGRQLEQQGKFEEALAAYSEALRHCSDHSGAREGIDRCPPRPGRGLELEVSGRSISLRWQASPSTGALRYRVVRKARSEPRNPGDGDILGEVAVLEFTDTSAEAGELYHYGVWTMRGSALANAPTLAGPAVRVEDVHALRATAGDGSVVLDYRSPPRARAAEVWRQVGSEPPKRQAGARVPSASLTSATDTGLTNGVLHGYRVVAVFEGPDGQPLYSPGVTCSVLPVELPRPVRNLCVVRRAGQFEVSWTPPPAGQVQVYALEPGTPVPTSFRVGESIPPEVLAQLGTRLPSSGANSARGTIPTGADLYLLPVTLLGSAVVVGEPASVGWLEDVEGLLPVLTDGQLHLRWTWPAGAEAALVTWRPDRFPTGPEDPRAQHDLMARGRYENEGGYRCKLPAVEEMYLAVYAATRRTGGLTPPRSSGAGSDRQSQSWQYASGGTPGMRVRLPIGKVRTLYYRIVPCTTWLLFPTGEYELRLLPSDDTTLPGLVLMWKAGGLPLEPGDGVSLLGVVEGQPCSPDEPLIVNFTPPQGFLPRSARLFPLNEDDCDWLNLVYVP